MTTCCHPCSRAQVSSSSVAVDEEDPEGSAWSDSPDDVSVEGPMPTVDTPSSDTAPFILEESSGYMEPSLRLLAIIHTLISFCCIIGYYCLKVTKYTCSEALKNDLTVSYY